MDIQLLIRSATNAKHKDKKDERKFLASITHLSLDKKGIEKIENLELCPNLNVLYLFENNIMLIEGLSKLSKLTQLSLQDNKIFKMEGFEGLVNLRRLYLEKNCIVRLEGLQNCRKLEELYLSKQTLPNDVEFTFDDYTLAAISMSLRVLDLQQCNVLQADPIYYLESLVQLNMRDNYISDIEGVIQFLRTLNNLRELDLRGNPVQKVPKYRDQMVMLGLKLQNLDDKKVMDQERRYLYNLVQQKEIKAEKQNQAVIRRQNSTSRLVGQNQPNMSDFQAHSTTAPNFGSKRQGSVLKPGNLSQQNHNPFGVTNRGYKGQMVKGMGKPPLSNMNNNGQPNKVMQQAGLSILGNQMTLGGTMYEGNQNYNDSNMDLMGQDGQYSGKNAAPKRYSANLVSGTDFSMGTQHMNTKMMPKRL